MEFLDLFVVALMPVLKVLLITAVGLFLALERIDLLGADATHHLNNLVFFVFSPALVVSNLADTITLKSLETLWFMPVNILLTFILGSAFGWILVKVARAPKHLHSLVIGCCAAGNLGNLLLIILPAVCNEQDSPFGDSSTCSTYGEAYASLSMAVGAIYIWSYVYSIMGVSAEDVTKVANANNSTTSTISADFSGSYREALLPSGDFHWAGETSDEVALPGKTPEEKVPILERIKQFFKNFTSYFSLKRIFAPSTIGAIAGFIIGIVSPIRKVLIGDDAPLRVIYNSADMLGEAAIPCLTLIIGANLLRGLKEPGVGPFIVIGIIGIRNVVLPIAGVIVVKAAHHLGMVESDSLYQFTLMLQYALPPAMNVGMISQLLGSGERECAVIMLWTYAVASFSLTIWSTCFMWLVT